MDYLISACLVGTKMLQ